MPTYNYSAILINDFSTKLYNKQLNSAQVKDYMKKLHKFSGFSCIVPRKLCRHILNDCKYYTHRIITSKDGIQYEDDLLISSWCEKKTN